MIQEFLDKYKPKGGFRPLTDEEKKERGYSRCNNIEHYPPGFRVFPEAGYWICPGCGTKTFIHGPITF